MSRTLDVVKKKSGDPVPKAVLKYMATENKKKDAQKKIKKRQEAKGRLAEARRKKKAPRDILRTSRYVFGFCMRL